MAYYSGQASSYQEIINIVVNHCTNEGWSWNDPVLSKGDAFISLQVANVGAYSDTQNLIRLVGGFGTTGSTLLNPSPIGFAIGTAVGNSSNGMTQFPIQYSLHINSSNEVYLICRYSVDFFMWFAWGETFVGGSFGVPASGRYANRHSRWPMVVMTAASGGGGNQDGPSCAFFWNTNYPALSQPKNYTCCIKHDQVWQTSVNAIQQAAPLVARQPSNFFDEAILLPIRPSRIVAENKTQILAEIQHARYLRIDHYEPEQIIALGHERWKVYPFYRKNTQQRNGGAAGGADHTGTFGWAIRYDGP